MKDFKVCLHIEEAILEPIKEMVQQEFTLVEDSSQCDIFLTDVYTVKNRGPINILIVDSAEISKYKGVYDLHGFNHYVIFSELSFLEDRVRKTLFRHYLLLTGKSDSCMGVNALIKLEKTTTESGLALPIIKSFKVTNSADRKKMADSLEEFFDEIESIVGFKNPIAVQYAVEIQEELLMNAIWDANPKHANMPRYTPVELNKSEEVNLQWAFNGKELAISVKDPFGRMDPNIMEKYIDFIFKTGRPIEHKLSEQNVSAGLGMYMVVQRANLLSVFVSDGKVTDVGVVLLIKAGRRSSIINSKAIDIINVKKSAVI